MKVRIKRQGEEDIVIECPFSVGNIVKVTEYSYAFFEWFVLVNPILKEVCPKQFSLYRKDSFVVSGLTKGNDLEWKIRKVVADIKLNELCILLTTRCGKTMWIQVKILPDAYDKKFKILPPIPFKVIDTSRKSIEEIEIKDVELSLNNNISR
jgi:hypothetical protein